MRPMAQTNVNCKQWYDRPFNGKEKQYGDVSQLEIDTLSNVVQPSVVNSHTLHRWDGHRQGFVRKRA